MQEIIKRQTDKLLKEFEEVYSHIGRIYEIEFEGIPEDPEKAQYMDNMRRYLEIRYKNFYLSLAEMAQGCLQNASNNTDLRVAFRRLKRMGKLILKNNRDIARASFTGIGIEAMICLITGIREEHELYVEKVKNLEKTIMREARRYGSWKPLG